MAPQSPVKHSTTALRNSVTYSFNWNALYAKAKCSRQSLFDWKNISSSMVHSSLDALILNLRGNRLIKY